MLFCTSRPQCLLQSAGAAIAIDAADVALFTNDLKCLAPVIKLGRNAKRKILLNISLSVVTKVRLAIFGSHT